MALLYLLLLLLTFPTTSHGQTLSGVRMLTLPDGSMYPLKYYTAYQRIADISTVPHQVFTLEQCVKECITLGSTRCNAADFLTGQPVGNFNCFTHIDPNCSLLPSIYFSNTESTHYQLSHVCDPVRVAIHDGQTVNVAVLPTGIIMTPITSTATAECGLLCNVKLECVASDYSARTGCRHFVGSTAIKRCLPTSTDSSFTTYMMPCYTAPFVGIHAGTVPGSNFISTTGHHSFSACRTRCQNDPQCMAYRFDTYWEFLDSLTFSSRCELNKDNGPGVNVACDKPTAEINRYTVYKMPCLNVDIVDIRPIVGPKSGGTSVTIRGFSLENVHFVTINNIRCNLQTKTLQNLTCLTGHMADGTMLDKMLDVKLHNNNSDLPYDTGLKYQYRPDPTITGIQPLKSILSGGVLITVNGTGFDIVNMRVMVTKVTSLITGRTYSTQTECSLISPTQMTCPMPPIDLSRLSRRRRRRQTDSTINTEENIDVEISFVLDGVEQYRDLGGTSLAGQRKITIYADPVLERFEATVQTFTPTWPVGDTHINIKGSMLLGGLERSDYTVKVGEAVCANVNVQDSLITCEPPNMRPEVASTEYVGENKIPIQVLYASTATSLGQLQYYQTLWEYPPGRYGILGVSGGLIFLIFVIILVACMCKRRPPTHKDTGHTTTYQRRIYGEQQQPRTRDRDRDREVYRDRDVYRNREVYSDRDRDVYRDRDRQRDRRRY